MAMVDRLLSFQSAATTVRTSADLLKLLSQNFQSASGVRVTPDTAMQHDAVYACVGLYSRIVGMFPAITYRRRENGGKDRARTLDIYRVLHDAPNPFQTAPQFYSMMTRHLMTRGNAYARINRVQGRVFELLPIHPAQVEIEPGERNFWEVAYKVRPPEGVDREPIRVRRADMLHLKIMSDNGIEGNSPVADGRETIGTALAGETFAARLYKSGIFPSMIVEHPGKYNEKMEKNILDSAQNLYGGLDNAHRAIMLWEGMTMRPASISPKDAQNLESRQWSTTQIARRYAVPLVLLQDTEKSTTWGSGIEQIMIGWATTAVLPLLRNIEQEITRFVIGQDDVFLEFLVDSLLRADLKTRYEAHAIALGNNNNPGWMRGNEVRLIENLNPIDDPAMNQVFRPQQPQASPIPDVTESAYRTAIVQLARQVENIGEPPDA